ncbi:AIR carboxylase family protein [Nitrosococcus wardiae]|uniref:AIR carboxylase family protein n=1 Tax=Nitrosococcus wardiae TaxID=1814290 RepID=UPI001F0D1111|nr:AIR carboxylase family protein [Nitrosococcus wardiae]
MANTSFVSVLMGSDSDLPVMQATLDRLTALGVPFEVRISSAQAGEGAKRDDLGV